MNKLNRYVIRHILLFCGIEERISCSHLNKILKQEYDTIIPVINDAKSLLGNIIGSVEINQCILKYNNLSLCDDNNIISKSYLSHSISLRMTDDGFETLIVFTNMKDNNHILIAQIILDWSTSNHLYWYKDKRTLEVVSDDIPDDMPHIPIRTIPAIFNCSSVINMLNNFIILIKKGSPKIYGKRVDWSKSCKAGLKWST
jgi:hypothetical protein